jgi:predicted nucleotidyltransferase
MSKDEVLKLIRSHKKELDSFNVKSLALFGSAARDESSALSDVDILVEFQDKATFDQYMKLKFFLEDTLGCPVDLVTRKALKPRIRDSVEREALHVT